MRTSQTIRPLYVLLTAMTISAVLILVSAGKAIEHEKSAAAARQVVLRTQEVGYILRESAGHLALFRENSPRPYLILDTEVWLLPEQDRLALADGIYLSTEAELQALLEDWDAESPH